MQGHHRHREPPSPYELQARVQRERINPVGVRLNPGDAPVVALGPLFLFEFFLAVMVGAAMVTGKAVKGGTGKAVMGGARLLRLASQHRPRLIE